MLKCVKMQVVYNMDHILSNKLKRKESKRSKLEIERVEAYWRIRHFRNRFTNHFPRKVLVFRGDFYSIIYNDRSIKYCHEIGA